MFHLIFFIFLLTGSVTKATECDLFLNVCVFSEVTLNRTNLYFEPTYKNVTQIQSVTFIQSVVPVLTDELCKAFPNLQIMAVDKIMMEEIAPNALTECKNLKFLSFHENKLTKIDINTFATNIHLTHLIFQNNFLKEFDGQTVEPLKALRQLALSDNYLTELKFEQFPILKNLTDFDIFHNDLRDLDVYVMLDRFPNLRNILMHNNLFNCDRLITIITVLYKRGVQIKEWQKQQYERNGDLPTIEGVECVPSPGKTVIIHTVPHQEKEVQKGSGIPIYVYIIVIIIIAMILICCCMRKRGRSSGVRVGSWGSDNSL